MKDADKSGRRSGMHLNTCVTWSTWAAPKEKCPKLRLAVLFPLTGVAKEKRQDVGHSSPSSEAAEFRANHKLRVKENIGLSVTLDWIWDLVWLRMKRNILKIQQPCKHKTTTKTFIQTYFVSLPYNNYRRKQAVFALYFFSIFCNQENLLELQNTNPKV